MESGQDWKLAVLEHGRETAEAWAEAAALLPIDVRTFRSDLPEAGRTWLREMAVFRVKDLEFGGSDAKAIGAKGERIGKLMGALLKETALGRLPNEKEALRAFAIQWMREGR
jgi:hypothetical protein